MSKGRLIPVDGGDPIELVKDRVLIGRRPDCDISLEFANVSLKHCELTYNDGYWELRDLQSSNGVRVNGVRVEKKRLFPGDQISVARKHHFKIEFDLEGLQQFRNVDDEEEDDEVFKRSLLDRAGLQRKIFDDID